MLTRMKYLIVSAVALVMCAAAFAPAASAGTYNVHSCKLPDGTPAPIDGWSYFAHSEVNRIVNPQNTCSTGDFLDSSVVALPNGASDTLYEFSSGDATIKSVSADFSQWSPGLPTTGMLSFGFFSASTSTSVAHGSCIVSSSPVCMDANLNGFSIAPLTLTDASLASNANTFRVTGGCYNSGGGPCGSVHVEMNRAAFTLEENVPPTFANLSGTLPANTEHKGVETFAFDLNDDYSGVYDVKVELDGNVINTIVPNINGGRCADVVSSTPARDFTSAQPCLASASISSDVDTKQYVDGYHAFKITATDAAGNESTISNEPSFFIKNNQVKPGAPGGATGGNNGSGGNLTTARFSSNSANIVRTKYNAKKTLPNRLVDATGAPIVGAQVDVYEHVNVAGAVRQRIATLVSDDQGWIVYSPRTTSNKLITFSWAAVRGSFDYATSDNVTLIVKGAVGLKLAKKRIRPGSRMQLKGTLYGEDMKRRIPVEILARDGKKWRVVAVVNTRANGKFVYRYKFKFVKNGKFKFKARVRGSSDLSVEPGASRPVTLRVR